MVGHRRTSAVAAKHVRPFTHFASFYAFCDVPCESGYLFRQISCSVVRMSIRIICEFAHGLPETLIDFCSRLSFWTGGGGWNEHQLPSWTGGVARLCGPGWLMNSRYRSFWDAKIKLHSMKLLRHAINHPVSRSGCHPSCPGGEFWNLGTHEHQFPSWTGGVARLCGPGWLKISRHRAFWDAKIKLHFMKLLRPGHQPPRQPKRLPAQEESFGILGRKMGWAFVE